MLRAGPDVAGGGDSGGGEKPSFMLRRNVRNHV